MDRSRRSGPLPHTLLPSTPSHHSTENRGTLDQPNLAKKLLPCAESLFRLHLRLRLRSDAFRLPMSYPNPDPMIHSWLRPRPSPSPN